MIVPIIGSSGKFKFAAPFDTLINNDQIFKVAGIRTINDLVASEQEPLDTIYIATEMTEDDYKEDLENDVPIIVFTSESNEFFYIPADRVLSEPINNGIPYSERSIIINLGYLPTSMNLDLLDTILKDDIYNVLGKTVDVEYINTSAVFSVEPDKHNTFIAGLENKKTVNKSYRTRYEELKQIFDARESLIREYEQLVLAGRFT